MTIRLLLLDMDDVVYAYDRAARIAVIAAETGLDPDLIERRIWDSGWQDQVDATAALSIEAYLEGWRDRLGVPISRDLWARARAAGMTPIAGTLALARAAAERGEIGVLTNNGPLLYAERHRLAPELAALAGPRFLVSSALDARKPDPEAFRRALARLGHRPEATLFVDDKAENAEGARAAGLRAHHFTGVEGLATALAAAGLLPEPIGA